MRQFMERLLRSVDPPDPERAERLWAEYRAGGAKADTAFATLMAWYGGTIYRRVWGFVRSDAADDVFQDMLVRLHRSRKRFTDFEHALRWLRGVAVTQSLNARRGEARRTNRERIRAVAGGTTTNEAEAVELREALRAALAKLPDREREAVALVYFEGMTRQDGAAVLGVNRDTVARLLETALGRLKSALAATAVGAALTTAGVESALAANPGLPLARLSVLAEAAWVNARSSGFTWPPTRKLVPLILAGGLLAVAAAVTLSWSGLMARSPAPVRLNAERLEPREVPSADFVSALGLSSATGASLARDVATDAAGNSYVTGEFTGTVDFDPVGTTPGDADVLTSLGSSDVFVAKYSPDNALVWVTRMGGAALEAGEAIDVDGNGNVYVTGNFRGEAGFGSINLTPVDTSSDGFVTKINPTGGVVWVKHVGQQGSDLGNAVSTDADGNVYALVSRTGAAGLSDNGYDILKWDTTGATVWAVFVNTNANSLVGDMAVDASGNGFVTGEAASTTDFDPAANKTKKLPSGGAFVLKLTSSGNYGWVSNLSYAIGYDIAMDGSGNVLVAGSYAGGLPKFSQYGAKKQNLPTGLTSAGRDFVAKLNNSGGLVWAKQIDSDSLNNFQWSGLAVDAAGSVYLTGFFSGTIDFNPGTGTHTKTSAGGNDIFVQKLTAAGNFAWAETFGGTGNDQGRGIAIDSEGMIHVGGSYRGTVDFDPDPNLAFDLTNHGSTGHMFLVRLRSN